MDDSLSIGSASDQDNEKNRMQYIRQDSLQPSNYSEDDSCENNDDDSSKLFFVSEPSTSEADSSENVMRLGALAGMDDNLLYAEPSASEDDNHLLFHHNHSEPQQQQDTNINEILVQNESNDSGRSSRIISMRPLSMPPAETFQNPHAIVFEGGGAPPWPPNALTIDTTITATAANTGGNYNSLSRTARRALATYSPDNMSLSSHDTASSAGSKEKVELDFIPVKSMTQTKIVAHNEVKERVMGVMKSGDKRVPGRKNAVIDLRKRDNIYKPKTAASAEDGFSNSSSSASETQVEQLGEFLDNLRINSEGQMRESSVLGSNTSFESSIVVTRETEVADVLRRNNSAGGLYGRRGRPNKAQPKIPNAAAVSSRDSSASRLSMDYTRDSFSNSRGAADRSISSNEDFRQKQQQADALVGDTIEIMVSTAAPPLLLPPLYTPTSTATASGRKQPHNRQRRSSADIDADTDTKSLNQDQAQHSYHHNDDAITNIESNPSAISNSLKSTIESSGDEGRKRQNEIGLFSQFALGTRESDGGRGRRSKRRGYRRLKTSHVRQESGEDSSSRVSSDQSYVNVFYSPPQQSPSQPPVDLGYQTNPSPSPRILPNGQGRTPGPNHDSFNISPRNRPIQNMGSFNVNESNSINPGTAPLNFYSYDGSYPSVRQQPSPHQLDSTNSATIPWGTPAYHSSQTYFPGHNRGSSEKPVLNQQFQFDYNNQHLHHQYSHTRSHSAATQQYENSPDVGNYNFLHSQQQHKFSNIASHAPTPQANHFFPEENNRNRNQSYGSSHMTDGAEHDLQKCHMEQQRRDHYEFEENTSYSVSDHSSDESIEKERGIHLLHGRSTHDNRVIRHHHVDDVNPIFDRRQFLPQTSTLNDNTGGNKYPTFVCPNCNMRQREFFTVSSAPRQYESEGTMISLVFAVYVVASLYIFGLQEGWGKLDCFYFAVITLTTAGLGDLVPTTDGAKIICSIFIYFGVACIGLLLGSYIAGMLDERSYREAVANQINACPNCARIKNMRYIAEQRRSTFATANSKLSMEEIAKNHAASLHRKNSMERASKKVRRAEDSTSQSVDKDMEKISTTPKTLSSFESPTVQKQLLGSPMTTQILHRQSHTRHVSMDLRRNHIESTGGKNRVSSRSNLDINHVRYRNNSANVYIPANVNEGAQSIYHTKNSTAARNDSEKEIQNANMSTDPPSSPPVSKFHQWTARNEGSDDSTSEDSNSYAESLESEVDEIKGRKSSTRNAKYIIFTLREALVNSLIIIAFGCLGFYLIEGFSFVDSLYFTTVLLTSTGYGDIVPKSDGGKLFATVYLLVGGTILLNNMSMISMIPLELRKRRTEHSVLTQFGDSLDDDALRELATGPLIQRINLGGKDSRGLDECTREMFALAMMIRLGKVTEHDIKLTFAAFRKLDVHNEGILNSKSIIGGMIQKRRRMNLTNRNSSISQGYDSWINYPAPSNFNGARNRSSSTNGSFDPSSIGHNVHNSDRAPLLSMSDRGFPQYGINQQYPTVPTFNE